MVEFAHRACRLYQQQGSPEAGAGALEKTAKMVEQKDPASAINVLQHAVEVLMVSGIHGQKFWRASSVMLNIKMCFARLQIEDSASRQAAEHLSKISRLQVRIQRYV